MTNEKQYWNEGASDYRNGRDQSNNPYNIWDWQQTERAQAWLHGYRMEKEYWYKESLKED